MTQINLTTAKQLCTATEFRLVRASNPPQVNQYAASVLKKHLVEARRLRDKWRDQSQRQRRSVQQAKGRRVVDDSTRSAEKAALFADVLSRFEAATPVTKQKPPTTKPSKARRSIEHRQTRAAVRESLSEHTLALRQASKKKTPTVAATAKKSAKKKVADTPTPAASGKTSSASRPATAGKKARPKPSIPVQLSLDDPQRFTQQLGAETAAKKSRFQRSGQISRIRGHVSARGRRDQGRRDSRG